MKLLLLLNFWIPAYIVSLLFAAALKSELSGVLLRLCSCFASFMFWVALIFAFKGQNIGPENGLKWVAIAHVLAFVIQVWRDKKGQQVK